MFDNLSISCITTQTHALISCLCLCWCTDDCRLTAALTCSASCGGCNSRKCGDGAGSEPKKKKRVNLLYVEALELSLLKALSVFMTLAPPLKPIGRTKKFAFSIRGNTMRAPVDRCRVNFPTFSSPPSRLCWRPEVFSPPPSALAC